MRAGGDRLRCGVERCLRASWPSSRSLPRRRFPFPLPALRYGATRRSLGEGGHARRGSSIPFPLAVAAGLSRTGMRSIALTDSGS